MVVKTEAERQTLIAECVEQGWTHDISVDAEADEYLQEIEYLRNRPSTVAVKTEPGRNDPCHCGSGKKYKKCCAA